jgi:hypothetical protein
MSRVGTIKEAQEKFNRAETALSSAIFKVFYPGRKIWYQTGYTEHPSGWVSGEVVGPVNGSPFEIRIKYSDSQCCGVINIDGRSFRLSIDPDPRNKQ